LVKWLTHEAKAKASLIRALIITCGRPEPR
jgi:hypothetical protein